jgi:hypothetical protein
MIWPFISDTVVPGFERAMQSSAHEMWAVSLAGQRPTCRVGRADFDGGECQSSFFQPDGGAIKFGWLETI